MSRFCCMFRVFSCVRVLGVVRVLRVFVSVDFSRFCMCCVCVCVFFSSVRGFRLFERCTPTSLRGL